MLCGLSRSILRPGHGWDDTTPRVCILDGLVRSQRSSERTQDVLAPFQFPLLVTHDQIDPHSLSVPFGACVDQKISCLQNPTLLCRGQSKCRFRKGSALLDLDEDQRGGGGGYHINLPKGRPAASGHNAEAMLRDERTGMTFRFLTRRMSGTSAHMAGRSHSFEFRSRAASTAK